MGVYRNGGKIASIRISESTHNANIGIYTSNAYSNGEAEILQELLWLFTHASVIHRGEFKVNSFHEFQNTPAEQLESAAATRALNRLNIVMTAEY